MGKVIGKLTGADSAKKAAAAQTAALEEQTRQAAEQAKEASRNAAIQTIQVQQRDQAVAQVEEMQRQDQDQSKDAEVTTGASQGSASRRRAKFNTPGASINSVSI